MIRFPSKKPINYITICMKQSCETYDSESACKRTCPEETIFQIGSTDEIFPPGVPAEIAFIFFNELNRRYGEHFHILDWSLHLDEATPHIHERHVFDCEDSYGFRFPQQEKALIKSLGNKAFPRIFMRVGTGAWRGITIQEMACFRHFPGSQSR